MDPILSALITQTPGTAAVIVVVVLFLRHLKEQNAIFLATMNKLVDQMNDMQVKLAQHAEETTHGIAEMHRRVGRRNRKAAK